MRNETLMSRMSDRLGNWSIDHQYNTLDYNGDGYHAYPYWIEIEDLKKDFMDWLWHLRNTKVWFDLKEEHDFFLMAEKVGVFDHLRRKTLP